MIAALSPIFDKREKKIIKLVLEKKRLICYCLATKQKP